MSERYPAPKPAEIGAFEPSDPSQSRSGHAGAKVTVACKLPHGLVLRIFEMVERYEPVMGGGSRLVKVAQATGESVVIHGNAVPFGIIPNYEIIAGFALTHNIDRDFWENWARVNAELPAVKKGLIFAYEDVNDARARAKEMAAAKSGLEPIDPGNLLADERVKAIGIRRGLSIERAT